MTEFVLDIVAGRERASILDHLQQCRACAATATAEAREADLLLLAAPHAPLPPGSEALIVAAVFKPGAGVLPAPASSRSRLVTTHRALTITAAVVVVVVVVVISAAVLAGIHGIGTRATEATARNTAKLDQPPRSLQGTRTANVEDRSGRRLGTAVLTVGAGASLLLSFSPVRARGPYQVALIEPESVAVILGEAEETAGVCLFTARLPIDPSQVLAVRLTGAAGAAAAVARFGS
jgi:hypothetical protein